MEERPEIPIVTTPINFDVDFPVHYLIFDDNNYKKIVKYLNRCIEGGQLTVTFQTSVFEPSDVRLLGDFPFTAKLKTPDGQHIWELQAPERGRGSLSNFIYEQWPEIYKIWDEPEYADKTESWYGVSAILVARED